jgi:methionyl-tRNA synthetase
MSGRTFYTTTPIYYVNDVPHIGHAYATLACDVMARFKRLDGYDVRFLTGTDEHGQKVEQSAEAAGLSPQAYADQVSQSFRDLIVAMNYSPDNFIRTTEKRHYVSCQALWQKLVASGDIYLGKYAGWYSVRDEAFYAEAETTVGPDGKRRAGPVNNEVEWVEEPSYFFKLSTWGDRLLEFYDKNPRFIAPESRRNEVISFVKGGLQTSRCRAPVSRGACRCQAIPSTSCMSGWMHSPTTSPSAASPIPAILCGASGRPTCMSSARTSSASTASIGRLS